MTHTVTTRGKLKILALSGEIDMHASPAARQVILDLVKTNSPVAIDLSAVKYMDSSGVATLVEGLQNAKKLGQGFVLLAPTGSVLGVIKLARLDKVFRIAASAGECDDLAE
ncbi:MAG: STAS domain-containing protein [Nitrosomonadales bacterium]|nr:STAS domain-containing protein [Nitrosomonadales bacterium]